MRIAFRQNRQARRRSDDWTRKYEEGHAEAEDTLRSESVRAKGALSRKRTVIMDEHDLPAVDEAQWRPGTVVRVHGLICYVHGRAGETWECTIRRVLRTILIESRSPVTVGDEVWFSDHSRLHDGARVGVIERVAPRRTHLARKDRRGRQHAIVANASQLLIVTSVAQPQLKPHLIDRYIVAALKGRLRPIVCVNKIDLAGDAAGIDPEDRLIYSQMATELTSAHEDIDSLEEEDLLLQEEVQREPITVGSVLDEFRALNYRCISTSVPRGAGLDELRDALRDTITVLSGQSGVGKSSLINAIQPGLQLKVSEVSAETEKGRHTTTFAHLLPLDFGGFVVDTPGIRAFDLWNVEPPELEALFEDFASHLLHCRFKDCLHVDEEGCAVRAAVRSGDLSRRRYLSYVKMYRDAAANYSRRGAG